LAKHFAKPETHRGINLWIEAIQKKAYYILGMYLFQSNFHRT
jgi:hypothetical protein